jgi:hypothetical protein
MAVDERDRSNSQGRGGIGTLIDLTFAMGLDEPLRAAVLV